VPRWGRPGGGRHRCGRALSRLGPLPWPRPEARRAHCARAAPRPAWPQVFSRLQNPGIPGVRGKINVFPFDKDTLERAGMGEAAGTQAPPFLVRRGGRCCGGARVGGPGCLR
jgi:hypothetical protein